MSEYLTHMASVADKISAGDLTVRVVPCSESDRFGNAFVAMIDNLTAQMRALAGSEAENRELAMHLAAARERLQHLLRSSPAILYSRGLSADSAFTFVGDNVSALLGCEPRTLLDQATRWSSRVHADDRSVFGEGLAAAIEQGEAAVEYRVRDAHGAYRWVHDEMRCNQVEVVGWWLDVTERRAAEDAHRRLVATLEATTDFVAICRPTGELVYLNHAARRIIGCAEGEGVTGRALTELHVPRAREMLTATAIPAAVATGTWEGETVLATAEGEELPVSQVIIAHPGGHGGDPFLSAIMRDISEWKRLSRMKNEFVSTVSHELRTPLTAIRGSLGLLEAGTSGPLVPASHKLVRLARVNSERLIRLINDMLDLDKIEAGKLDLRRSPIVASELVTATLDGIRGMAIESGIAFESSVTASQCVDGDRDRVVQVLTNLVSNAVKFSPKEGTVRVTALDCANGDGTPMVRFTVENQGPGIVAADLLRLFRRFQQLDGSDSRRHGGTGLGLAISKAIVEQHGGRIGVESEPGVVTRFWFEMPVSRPG
jgi:PAS domain S-box-containing protein